MDSDFGMPPPPPPPPPPSPSARYAYLVGRLRHRQITMNEATELFELQQTTLASALARAQTVPSPPPEGAPPASSTTPAPPASLLPAADDAFWMGLLAMGAGAGLLAAVLKRSRAGADPPAPTDRSGPSP